MKKGLSVMLAVCLCFACLLVASPAAYAQDARAMPVPFTFTDRVVLTPNLQDSFPPGTAEFDVTITGLYDAHRVTMCIPSNLRPAFTVAV